MQRFFEIFRKKSEPDNAVDNKQLREVFTAAEETRSTLQREEAALMVASRALQKDDPDSDGVNARLKLKSEELSRLEEAIKAYRKNNNSTNFSNLKNLVLPDQTLLRELPIHLVEEEEDNRPQEDEDAFSAEELEQSRAKLLVLSQQPLRPATPIVAPMPVPAVPAPVESPVPPPAVKRLKIAEPAASLPLVPPKAQTEVKEREIPVNNQTYTETIIKKGNKGKDQIIHKAEGESLSTPNRQKTIMSMIHQNLTEGDPSYQQNIYLRTSSKELTDQAIMAIFTVDPHYQGKIHITGLNEAETNERITAVKKQIEPAYIKKQLADIVQEIESSKTAAARP
jgi:hypothetical protein